MATEDSEAQQRLPEHVTPTSSTFDKAGRPSRTAGWKAHLMENVDPDGCIFQCVSYCFMTGYIDAISFTAVFIWCGFQTGNTVQLSLALARLFQPGQTDFSFRIPDRQALTSLISFLLGASVGRLGDKIGAKTRGWLFLGTFIQALMTMVAAVAIFRNRQGSIAENRGDPAWTGTLSYVGLAFASASIGLQGIMGKRVNSQFATTVVLTTIWCELMADPSMFRARFVKSRDHKLLSVFGLFLGGFVSRAIVDKTGAAWALGIGALLRVFIALTWIPAPAKTAAKDSK